MEYKFLDEKLKYTGDQLQAHFAYKNFNVRGDSVISFTGGCDVKLTEMVDIEDVLENAPIYSENMLHFIIEHFNISLVQGVLRQRLLVAIAKDVVAHKALNTHNIERFGDDIFANDGKLSVSIATKSPTSVLIHFAMNITSANTPVKTSGLTTELGIEDIKQLANTIANAYIKESRDMYDASTKVRGVN